MYLISPKIVAPLYFFKTSLATIDVIIDGMETIGSAERGSNPQDMRESFYSIFEGGYANKLFNLFGRERVERELEAFLSCNFTPRFGGGIGLTRLIQSLECQPTSSFMPSLMSNKMNSGTGLF